MRENVLIDLLTSQLNARVAHLQCDGDLAEAICVLFAYICLSFQGDSQTRTKADYRLQICSQSVYF